MKALVENKQTLSHEIEIFTCTIGKKAAISKYYVNDQYQLFEMLNNLANLSPKSKKTLPNLHSIQGDPKHIILPDRCLLRKKTNEFNNLQIPATTGGTSPRNLSRSMQKLYSP